MTVTSCGQSVVLQEASEIIFTLGCVHVVECDDVMISVERQGSQYCIIADAFLIFSGRLNFLLRILLDVILCVPT